MDKKLVKALTIIYGNYRSAITAYDMCDEKDVRRHAADVVATGKALLALQEALDYEAASAVHVEAAVNEARRVYGE